MEHLDFIFFIELNFLLNFMISASFQQLKKKKKKFRGFSTHFVEFQVLMSPTFNRSDEIFR